MIFEDFLPLSPPLGDCVAIGRKSEKCLAEPGPELVSGSSISASHRIKYLRDPEINSGGQNSNCDAVSCGRGIE